MDLFLDHLNVIRIEKEGRLVINNNFDRKTLDIESMGDLLGADAGLQSKHAKAQASFTAFPSIVTSHHSDLLTFTLSSSSVIQEHVLVIVVF